MFNHIIHFSLSNKLLIIAAALILLCFGTYETVRLPIDVLPDLSRPRVTVMTECPGMAPEEVESFVTRPLEIDLNGATGVTAIRSNSQVGLSVTIVEFDWGMDPYRCRQIVSERLSVATNDLPEGITPEMTPLSSVMGQIAMLAMWDETGKASPMELRTLADWVLRIRLMGIEGVSEVFTIGGDRKQYQVRVRTDDLLRFGTTLDRITEAIGQSNSNVTGGYLINQGPNQLLVRSLGRILKQEDLANLVVEPDRDPPLLLSQVADISEQGAIPVGSAAAHIKTLVSRPAAAGSTPAGSSAAGSGSASGNESKAATVSRDCVVLTIEKQPSKDTRVLTDQIESEIAKIRKVLHEQYPGIQIESLYEQKTFINLAIANCIEALWLGAVLVVVVLALFLMNLRTTLITVAAMPLAIVTTCLTFTWFGLSVNTMTLGGLAVAIGELVDDAIVDVENIFRRLKLNFQREKPLSTFDVVFNASTEIRNSIVHGTMIVILVFFPLFFLTGIEGRLFAPLGVAYVVSILSSLAVSLTVTPALCYVLLPSSAKRHVDRDGFVLRSVQYLAEKAIRFSLACPILVLTLSLAAAIAAAGTFLNMKRDFMPPFNEGALQVNMDLMPGTSLKTTSEVADKLSARLLAVDGIASVVRKTGRSEMDEHAIPANTSEMVCSLDPNTDRTLDEILDDVQELISPESIPGTVAFYDQPLQHLINHLRSGTKAKIAIKVRGDEPSVLRQRAKRIQEILKPIPDIGSLRADPIQVDIPQVRITLKRDELARYGLRPDKVNRIVETAMNGTVATEVLEGERTFEVLVQLSDKYRENLEELLQLPIDLENGAMIPLQSVAQIDARSHGPSQIDREKNRPQIVIQSNPRHRGAVDVKDDIVAALAPYMNELTANNVELELAGLFESEQAASRRIALLTCLSMIGVFLVLYSMFKSVNLSLQILAILPLALVGAVAAMAITGQGRSVPILVGMISLCGIASRNGILLIDHYRHLIWNEGETFSRDMIVRAGRDRVAPVLMTALTSAIGLIPLTLAANEPGREILYPIATVVVGGMITSTLMEFFVRPALFWTFGQNAISK